jgi:hypothetical protein
MDRIGEQVERWVHGMGPQQLAASGFQPLPSYPAASRLNRLSYLENYFIKLVADLPKEIDDAHTFAVTGV